MLVAMLKKQKIKAPECHILSALRLLITKYFTVLFLFAIAVYNCTHYKINQNI